MESFASWVGLVQAAVLEVDASEKLALISRAREAITARLQASHLSAAELQLQQTSQNLFAAFPIKYPIIVQAQNHKGAEFLP